MILNTVRYPIPDVPKGWKPDPRRVWENKENVPSAKGKQREDIPKTHAGWKSSLLTADEVRRYFIVF